MPGKILAKSAAAVVAAGILLVTGGLSWQAYEGHRVERAFTQAVSRCVTAVGHADAAEDARTDFQNGQRDFYFISNAGFVPLANAPGVFGADQSPADARACRFDPSRNGRGLPFQQFMQLRFARGDQSVDAPRETECGMAIWQYVTEYNAEMADLSPKSIEEFCD